MKTKREIFNKINQFLLRYLFLMVLASIKIANTDGIKVNEIIRIL